MPKVLVYPNMSAVLNNRPQRVPVKKRKNAPKSVLWMRDMPLLDRGLRMAKRPRIESMVVCFDTPEGLKLDNPFPDFFFQPDRTIFMAGTITAELARIVKENILNKAQQDPNKPIILWIDSPGGDVSAGLMIKEAIEAVKPNVHTVAMGGVSSMAAFLTAFGTKGHRYILENSILMYHEVRYSQKMVLSSADMEEAAAQLGRSTEKLFSLLAEASGNKPADIQARFSGTDVYYNAREAVQGGFVDGVIMPVRYYGYNPWGWKVLFPRSPLQKSGKKVVEMKAKLEAAGERPEKPQVRLAGYLDAMKSYKRMAEVVSHIVVAPKDNVWFEVKNSPGGFVEEAHGLFDMVRLVNALPNCGDVMTVGRGKAIGGMSALVLAAGKAEKRELESRSKLVLKGIIADAPAHAPASRVDEISEEVNRFEEMMLINFSRHARPSLNTIREEIARSQEENAGSEGWELTAGEAEGEMFVDKIVEPLRKPKKAKEENGDS